MSLELQVMRLAFPPDGPGLTAAAIAAKTGAPIEKVAAIIEDHKAAVAYHAARGRPE